MWASLMIYVILPVLSLNSYRQEVKTEKLLIDTGEITLPDEIHHKKGWPGAPEEYQHYWDLPTFNWYSPVNYADGTLETYFELIDRPTDKTWYAELILEETNGENMLQRYLNQQAFRLLEQRGQEVGQLKTVWDWQARQQKVKGILSEITGPFPDKTPINSVVVHSPYNLLSTSLRIRGKEVTARGVHDQVKLTTEYAKERGIGMALDMDVRLARRAFETKYPDEMQEQLRLREVTPPAGGTVDVAVRSIDLADHMTGNTEH